MAKTARDPWRDRFYRKTSELMSSMRQRHKRKQLPPPEFDLEDLRAHILKTLGTYDGVIQCRYCPAFVDVLSMAADHALPIKRGGGLGLDNIEFPCQPCNNKKGGLKPDEFLAYIKFRNTLHPAAQVDLDKRLQTAVQLAGAQNWGRKKAKGTPANV